MKNTKIPPRIFCALSLAALSLAFSTPAEALDWNWTFTQNNELGLNAGNGSGTFTTEDTPNNGIFLITAMSGSFQNLGTISSLLPPGTFQDNDNFLGSGGGISRPGISFTVGSLNYYNLYSGDNVHIVSNGTQNSPGSFSATPVPLESDALPILGSAVFMAGGLWWKRRRA